MQFIVKQKNKQTLIVIQLTIAYLCSGRTVCRGAMDGKERRY